VRPPVLLRLLVPSAALLALVACGSDDTTSGSGGSDVRVVVTTSVLGDVVQEVVGDAAEVQVLIPAGTDPHDVQLSARQVNDLRTADAVVVNGEGLEAGLLDPLEAAQEDGVPQHEAISGVEVLELGRSTAHADEPPEGDEHADDAAEGEDHADEAAGGDHAGDAAEGDEHADDPAEGEEHADDPAEGEEHADEPAGDDHPEEDDGHSHATGDVDPHFFTDPDRMADAVDGIVAFLADEVPALDTPEVAARAEAYQDDLRALAAEVDETLAAVPEARRVIVTNHDVFAYFADRFGFEVVGVVIPGGGTQGSASAAELQDLAEDVDAAGVEVVFTDATASSDLADTLADEAGGLEVVPLLTESLAPEGDEGDTYVGMVTVNAARIADALG
jgi:zinc/manganese transport system substrate-binding protein